MIKKFRKNKIKILAKNKFFKYLFYAIEEIVHELIGIFIPLNINNKRSNENYL